MTYGTTPDITRLTVLHDFVLFFLVILPERGGFQWIPVDVLPLGFSLIEKHWYITMVKTACLQLDVIFPNHHPDSFLKPYTSCFKCHFSMCLSFIKSKAWYLLKNVILKNWSVLNYTVFLVDRKIHASQMELLSQSIWLC